MDRKDYQGGILAKGKWDCRFEEDAAAEIWLVGYNAFPGNKNSPSLGKASAGIHKEKRREDSQETRGSLKLSTKRDVAIWVVARRGAENCVR